MGRDYKNIKAWQLADKLTLEIYKITDKFPSHELYGVVSQIRRAAFSVPANIVEGANRNHSKEYLQFLFVARASLAELGYFLSLSKNVGYLSEEEYHSIDKLHIECSKTLQGLINYISNGAN